MGGLVGGMAASAVVVVAENGSASAAGQVAVAGKRARVVEAGGAEKEAGEKEVPGGTQEGRAKDG
ncbi:MAG: hypothetical protein SGPRY_009914 [Prymnesium sp.]